MKQTFASVSIQNSGPVYLDCNATTPMEPAVRNVLVHWLTDEVGNAGSRTHEYGLRAKRAVGHAREQVAAVVGAKEDEVLFTSGATESNNIAILGLARYGEGVGGRHIVSTAIEHKAVLEPLDELERCGFEITLIPPNPTGAVSAAAVRNAVRPDTLLVSVMHANNETGVLQPVSEIADLLLDSRAYLHVDAAQGYGKDLMSLRHKRIDLISVSSHKIYGPSGVGALVARRRGFKRPPLSPLLFGGGQERGLRPGTLPVALIVALGKAAEHALAHARERDIKCRAIREAALAELETLPIRYHGDPQQALPHVLNFSVDKIDSEAIIIVLKRSAAVSNGAACTSERYQSSHVLEAMNLPQEAIDGAVRISWCHMTPLVNWREIVDLIHTLA